MRSSAKLRFNTGWICQPGPKQVAIDFMISFQLFFTGLLAGGIDSIAGGGGLISLPILFLLVGPGPTAIGTNKVSATMGAFVALMVYFRKGHMNWRKSLVFAFSVAIGSSIGSRLSPQMPQWAFSTILGVTCPLILYILWNKDLWVKIQPPSSLAESKAAQSNFSFFKSGTLIASGLVCGIYDGAWGPGGGTFMFLALTVFAKMSLLTAIAASKLANTFSGGTALMNYAAGGYVRWMDGTCLAIGMSVGALVGATHASKYAAKVVRPVLAAVVSLLMIKLYIG